MRTGFNAPVEEFARMSHSLIEPSDEQERKQFWDCEESRDHFTSSTESTCALLMERRAGVRPEERVVGSQAWMVPSQSPERILEEEEEDEVERERDERIDKRII